MATCLKKVGTVWGKYNMANTVENTDLDNWCEYRNLMPS